MNDNEIILFAREEADQLVGRVLTDNEWLKLRELIIIDDNMWEVIDECIKISTEELK